jgi:glycosyltransferase involved in cell wall biosynthesis
VINRQQLPSNLRLLGVVGDTEKLLWLKVASVGLNPIISGAGTNLKLAEYAAAGLPIISTAFGARGGVLLPDTHITVCDGDAKSLAHALQRWSKQSEQEHQAQITAAFQRVRDTLDWEKIALSYADFLTA